MPRRSLVQPVEQRGDPLRLDRVVGREQRRAERRLADAPAGIDARPEQKAEMAAVRRACSREAVMSARKPGRARCGGSATRPFFDEARDSGR